MGLDPTNQKHNGQIVIICPFGVPEHFLDTLLTRNSESAHWTVHMIEDGIMCAYTQMYSRHWTNVLLISVVKLNILQ